MSIMRKIYDACRKVGVMMTIYMMINPDEKNIHPGYSLLLCVLAMEYSQGL